MHISEEPDLIVNVRYVWRRFGAFRKHCWNIKCDALPGAGDQTPLSSIMRVRLRKPLFSFLGCGLEDVELRR